MTLTTRSSLIRLCAFGALAKLSHVLPVIFIGVLASPVATRAADIETGEASQFNSSYNFVKIEKSENIVTFRYMHNGSRMSAVDLNNPAYQIVPYVRYFFGAELFKNTPEKVLMAGLGAAGFNRLFRVMNPTAMLTTVEIDEMILDLAQKYAGYEVSPADNVMIADARIYIRRSRETFDWIVLDAFDIQAQIPIHLMTKEFFTLVSNRLSPDGVLTINLHQGTELFQSQISTMRSVFPLIYIAPVKGRSNVVAFALKSEPNVNEIFQTHANFGPRESNLKKFGVDTAEIKSQLIREVDYTRFFKKNLPILTDDFAPAESLNMRAADEIIPPSSSQN